MNYLVRMRLDWLSLVCWILLLLRIVRIYFLCHFVIFIIRKCLILFNFRSLIDLCLLLEQFAVNRIFTIPFVSLRFYQLLHRLGILSHKIGFLLPSRSVTHHILQIHQAHRIFISIQLSWLLLGIWLTITIQQFTLFSNDLIDISGQFIHLQLIRLLLLLKASLGSWLLSTRTDLFLLINLRVQLKLHRISPFSILIDQVVKLGSTKHRN